jgi:hypothetical protein
MAEFFAEVIFKAAGREKSRFLDAFMTMGVK